MSDKKVFGVNLMFRKETTVDDFIINTLQPALAKLGDHAPVKVVLAYDITAHDKVYRLNMTVPNA